MLLKALQQHISLLMGRRKLPQGEVAGLELGPDNFKLLKINQSEPGFMVENFSISPLPAGAIVKDEIKDVAAIGQALREMVRQSGIATKNVALSIPRSLAIIKTITVDSRLTKDDIESRAWIEANRHFPDLVGDIYLDFVITGPSVQDTTQLELILVACRKEQITPYIDALHEGGLVPQIVDINSYALERALRVVMRQSPQLETVALLNLNKNLSTFIVVNRQILVHAHDQSYDGQRLLNQVRGYLKDKPMDQSSSKQGLVNDVEYNNLLRENLISHLRHTVHFSYSSRPNINLQQIVLAGDCAVVPDLSLFIQNEIGIETVVADPFKTMAVARGLDKDELAKQAPALMLAAGLALSEIVTR